MTSNSEDPLQIDMEQEAYFKSIFDNALYGIATTVGSDFRFVRVNDAFCQLLEYDRDELEGVRSVSDVTYQDDYPDNENLLARLVNNEIQRFRIEKKYVTKSGRCIDVIVYVLGFYDNDGKYVGSTGSVMDITETNELLDKLRKRKSDLEQLTGRILKVQEEERRRLARELHDDLSQRMAILSIETGKLISNKYSSEVVEQAENIQQRLMSLSEDIHGISRQLHPSVIEDLGLIDALRSEINRFLSLEEFSITFTSNIETANPPLDVAVCLFRVTQESLRNITKHAYASSVTIEFLQDHSSLILTISDNGRGFNSDTVTNKPGLGMKSMSERMRMVDGKISFTSEQGQGTIVRAIVNM